MSDSETKSDSENDTPNCPNGNISSSSKKDCTESSSKGVKKNKKKRVIRVIEEVDVSDDDTDEEQGDEDVNDAGVMIDAFAPDTPTHVAADEPTRSSSVYILMKFLFLLSCVSTISSGIFVAHTVRTAPNSKLGKLFIRSGHFVSELVTIMKEDKVPLLAESDPVGITLEKERITAEGVKHRKSITKKNHTPVESKTLDEQQSLPETETEGFSLQSVYGFVMHVVALYVEDEVEIETEVESEGIIYDEVEEAECDVEEIGVVIEVPEAGGSSRSSESRGIRIGWTDAIGVMILLGSAIIRCRPQLRAMNDAQLKYFRKEKNVKFARTASYFILFLSVVLIGGWFFFNEGNDRTGSVAKDAEADDSLSRKGNLSVSDIIAVVIVVLSTVFLATKQLAQAKRFNSSKAKYKCV